MIIDWSDYINESRQKVGVKDEKKSDFDIDRWNEAGRLDAVRQCIRGRADA